MHRISQDEYTAAHRVYSYVERIIGPYYGFMPLDQTSSFVSENRWIMFPVKGIDSLREGTVYPLPNIFISFENAITDDGAGKVNGNIGITYHNIDAMTHFNGILRRPSKSQKLLEIINSFSDDWGLSVLRKTKTDCPNSAPRYETYKHFLPSKVSVADLQKSIAESNKTLLQRGDTYPESGNPVLWSVTIIDIEKHTTISTFDNDIKYIFSTFLKLLDIR